LGRKADLCATAALRLDPQVIDPIPYYMLMLDHVHRQAAEFDFFTFTSTTCISRYFVTWPDAR
jgi:hypothetical protein